MTFWKRENHRDSKNISGYQVLERREWWICRTQKNFRTMKNILYDTTVVDTSHYTFVKIHRSTTLRMNLNIHYGPRVIMMCQCRFLSYNKCTTLVSDDPSGGVCRVAGTGRIWEPSVLSAQLSWEPKTALKHTVY